MVKKKEAKKAEKKEESKKEDKKIPLGVKIISVVVYINAALLALAGLVYLFYGITGENLASEVEITRAALYIVAVIFIGLGVFAFFVARGLWKGRNWARVVMIILAVIGIIQTIATFFYEALTTFDIIWNLINLAVNGLIGGYLAFNKNVKKAFS